MEDGCFRSESKRALVMQSVVLLSTAYGRFNRSGAIVVKYEHCYLMLQCVVIHTRG